MRHASEYRTEDCKGRGHVEDLGICVTLVLEDLYLFRFG
jgi:hypothetical protein